MTTIQAAIAVPKASGLEGVVFADTQLSDVDGERGRLVIRGYDVESLAAEHSFEEALGLLWEGSIPNETRRREIERALGTARAWAFTRVLALTTVLSQPDGMDALRASIATLHSGDDSFERATEIVAAIAVFASAWSRLSRGLDPIAPDPNAPHGADYLHMLRGDAVSDHEACAMDSYLVTVLDHGMNASTFAARVVASTASDLVSSVVAAVGALKGPLHGGAPGPVLDMLDAIGSVDRAETWLLAEISASRRIMGMGHRVYRVRDPRAAVLERAVERLESAGVASARLPLARAVERVAEGVLAQRHPDRGLRANVEFYTAVLLDVLRVPREAFTPTFAASRVVGWVAHVREQRVCGKLIRPASRYVGPAPDSRLRQ